MAEFNLINILKQRCVAARADVHLGMGDDAAVVAVPADHDLVICTDTLVAGVHFPTDTDAADIGWKSLAVNLSDLAAMGAIPAWTTLALTLPADDADFVTCFADGFAELAAEYEVALIGGDTTRGPLTISVTAHGFVPSGNALRRAGAEVGDAVFVTGTLGDAAAGLHCLQHRDMSTTDKEGASQSASGPRNDNGMNSSAPTDCQAEYVLIGRLNRPHPRIAAGTVLRDLANACIDVSDGLLADLGHIACASKIGIDIDEDHLPGSTALFAQFDVASCRQFQLSGGDDYELAFTIAEARIDELHSAMARVGCAITRVGRVVAEPGVRVFDRHGRIRQSHAKGWEHFR